MKVIIGVSACILLLVAAVPAWAQEAQVTVTYPVAGATYRTSEVSRIGLELNTSPYGAYQVQLSGPNGGEGYDFVYAEGDSSYVEVAIAPEVTEYPGDYTITVWFDGGPAGGMGFEVEAPPPPLEVETRLSDYRFFPVVRDGYRDSVHLIYRPNQEASHTVAVLDSNGNEVMGSDLGFKIPKWEGYAFRWRWSGRAASGEPVSPGTYRIVLTSSSESGALQVTEWVDAVSEVQTTRHHLSKAGHKSARYSGPGCRTARYQYLKETVLDCWDGSYATATYSFDIPRKADITSWKVWGEQGCCRRGVLNKRTYWKNGRFIVSVHITGWRYFTVKRVGVNYKLTRRV